LPCDVINGVEVSALRGDLPLRFGWQPSPGPTSNGIGFVPTEVPGRLVCSSFTLAIGTEHNDGAALEASELRANELRAGATRLASLVVAWRPRTLALLGVTLLPFVLPGQNDPGPGLERALFCGARVFVLPNPSGRNLSFPGITGKLPWYRALASLV
jgi:hypothetical protein